MEENLKQHSPNLVYGLGAVVGEQMTMEPVKVEEL